MDRSRFPNGVPVTGSDLQFDSEARQDENKRVLRDGMQTGVRTGFTVSAVPARTHVVVAPGNGYVGDVDFGSQIDSTFGSFIKNDASSVSLVPGGGWVLGVAYYVNAVYTESDTIQRPDLDAVALHTVRTESVDVNCTYEVMLVSDYLALSDTDKHKRLKVARVIPSGPGATILDNDIENVYVIEKVKTASGSMDGVTLTDVSAASTDGSASLEWDLAGQQMRWKDAADIFGAWVSVTADGSYSLYSSDVTKFIRISVIYALLPSTDVVATIVISDLYEGVLRPSSGADRLLRSYGGSGLKTKTNPMGLTLPDLGGGEALVTEHQVEMHDNGIVGSSSTLIAAVVKTVEDYITLTPPVNSKFYIRGEKYTELFGSDRPSSPGAFYTLQFDDYSPGPWTFFEVYVDENGILKRNQRAYASPGATGIIITDLALLNEIVPFSFRIDYTYLTPAERKLSFNNGPEIILFPSVDAAYTLYGENGYDKITVWIDWANLDTSSHTPDTWTGVNPAVNRDTNLVICNALYYNGDIFGIGATWNGTIAGTPFDKRQFGTLAEDNLTTECQDYVEFVGREVITNGVLKGLVLSNAAPAVLKASPGTVFIQGKKIDVIAEQSLDVTTFGNGNYYVWINESGGIESTVEPIIGVSTIVDEALYKLTKEKVIIAYITVTTGVVSKYIDKRYFVGIQSNEKTEDSDGLGIGISELTIKKSPQYTYNKVVKVGNEVYLASNLTYSETTGLWSLLDSTKDGVAISTSEDGSMIKTYRLRAGSVATVTLPEGTWPTYYADNYRSYFRQLFGDGSDNDITVPIGGLDLGIVREKKYRNLTLNGVLTGNGPYLAISVEDTLTINTNGAFELKGIDGTAGLTGSGGIGGSGKGGRGGDSPGTANSTGGEQGYANAVEILPATIPRVFTFNSLFAFDGTAGGNGAAVANGLGGNGGTVNGIESISAGGGGGGGSGRDTGGATYWGSGGGGGGGGGIGGNGGAGATNAVAAVAGSAGRGTLGATVTEWYFAKTGLEYLRILMAAGIKGWGGGGGAGGENENRFGGGGGGGGGAIFIEAKNVIINTAGNIGSVIGGAGGAGRAGNIAPGSGPGGGGGGGGGGGTFVIVFVSCNLSDSAVATKILATGGSAGSGGAGSGTGSAGAAGAAGGVGIKAIVNLAATGLHNI